MSAPRIPHSPEAEASVIGKMIAQPKIVGEVVGTLLEPRHFYVQAMQRLYYQLLDAYYADEPIDPLTIGELAAKDLARAWRCEESEAIGRVQQLALGQAATAGEATDHAKLVKRDADYRALLDLAAELNAAVLAEKDAPDVVAGTAAQTAMQIATSTLLTHDILSYEDVGRNFVLRQKELMAARAAGVEIGAYFGLKFLDNYTRGFRPSELFILAGEPGVGKSAVAWKAAERFAERQMRKAAEQRIGAFVLSLEMSEEPSSTRLAQSVSGVDGGTLREGRTTDFELAKVIREWGKRRDIPLYFNFTSALRASQMRALIVEAIRRHNVGLIVIDHMRYFDMDGNFATKTEEDEEKAKFLKQRIAKDLNVAVMCLAHTTKGIDSTEDRRPKLTHLRGSGQVAAEADFVGFVYRPYNHASASAKDSGQVKRTDAELIYAKSRHSNDDTAHFYFDPATMQVY